MKNGDGFWGFIDWTGSEQANAGCLSTVRRKLRRSQNSSEYEKAEELKQEAEAKTASAKNIFLMKRRAVRQWRRKTDQPSQVWMILAEAVSGEEGAEILDRLVELKPEKENGFSVYEPSFCGSASDVVKTRQ